MNLYEDQFSQRHDSEAIVVPQKTLIIASTPRSGSHMIGHFLHSTDKFGFPLEYAHSPNLDRWKAILKTSNFCETLTEIQKRRTSSNGVFSIKTHYEHLQAFGGFLNLLNYFPNPYIVFITRKNLLEQAISHAIAAQTGVWISGQEKKQEPVYNFDYINMLLEKTIYWNASWRYLFATTRCRFLEVNYEDARDDMKECIKKISAHVNEDIDDKSSDNFIQRTKPQQSEINSNWKEKFLDEHNGRELRINSNRTLKQKLSSKIKSLL